MQSNKYQVYKKDLKQW